LLGDIASRTEIDPGLAEKIATALRESNEDKKQFKEDALKAAIPIHLNPGKN